MSILDEEQYVALYLTDKMTGSSELEEVKFLGKTNYGPRSIINLCNALFCFRLCN